MTKKVRIKDIPLIKFQNKDKIKCLQKGLLYAKTAKYYRGLEKTEGNDQIGDATECMFSLTNVAEFTVGSSLQKNIDKVILPTPDSDDFLFCMFGISNQNKQFVFSDEQKEKMLSFGDTALVINDSTEFKRRVCIAAKRKGIKAQFGAVSYYNNQTNAIDYIMSLFENNLSNIPFLKDYKYEYQQEMRFVFSPGNGEDHIELDIGDISDITEVISSEKILNNTLFIQR